VWEKDAPPRVLELNGMVKALSHWAHYVRNGHRVKVCTDHRSLAQKLSPDTDDSPQVRNLYARACQFDVCVEYTPGKAHVGPDWWSREGIDSDPEC
jgi:hypothetical protein